MKKFKVFGILILLIFSMFFIGCNSNLKNQSNSGVTANVQGKAVNSNTTSTLKNDNTTTINTYINVKYFYRISYPKEWADIVESETEDGALLYYKDDNDVRTYADKAEDGYVDSQSEQAKTEGKKVSEIVSDDGLKGILITGDEKGKKLTHAIYFSNGTHYDFYASVKEDFNSANEKRFLQVAKSMKLLNQN